MDRLLYMLANQQFSWSTGFHISQQINRYLLGTLHRICNADALPPTALNLISLQVTGAELNRGKSASSGSNRISRVFLLFSFSFAFRNFFLPSGFGYLQVLLKTRHVLSLLRHAYDRAT